MPVSREEQNELVFAGPLELARMVREREVSARELVEVSLARIERLDPRLNAFRETLPDLALTTAAQIAGAAPAGRCRAAPALAAGGCDPDWDNASAGADAVSVDGQRRRRGDP